MSKKKLINDPIYGFIQFPYEILYDIIDHPYVQRLRRISQMGLSHYIYPGAVHTRFHHTLGALHLMVTAIDSLRSKDVQISDQEAEATCIAILLHDIGHGPFSHALENSIINVSHEFLSVQYLKFMEESFGEPVTVALEIFLNKHPKHFLHQLVSSQLDMDRMDYLNRDSFYTGVIEGKIGYDRIIKMLNVRNNELVVEEKGTFSVEKFLIARRMMYWQVYLHKTSVSIEQMLLKFMRLIKEYIRSGEHQWLKEYISENLYKFLSKTIRIEDFETKRKMILDDFSSIDDYDIYFSLKKIKGCKNELLRFYASSILDRKIFTVESKTEPFTHEEITNIKTKLLNVNNISISHIDDLLLLDEESNISYSTKKESIKILKKTGEIIPIHKYSQNLIDIRLINKYFLCYPKIY